MTALVDVYGREYALFGELAVKVYLHVACALEFLVNYIVHAAAGLDEGGSNYGKAASVFDVAGSAEEALGLMQRSRIHTAGKSLTGGGDGNVVGAGKAGYGVYEDYHVLALLHQAHSALLGHLGHAGMMLRQLVKGGVQYLTLYAALHIRDFLGPLVYEQHYKGNVGIVVGYSVGYVLEQRSLGLLLGWLTIRPRWPLPMGAMRSTRRMARFWSFAPVPSSYSRVRRSLGYMGTSSSKGLRFMASSGSMPFMAVMYSSARKRSPSLLGRVLPVTRSPVRRPKRRIWAMETYMSLLPGR